VRKEEGMGRERRRGERKQRRGAERERKGREGSWNRATDWLKLALHEGGYAPAYHSYCLIQP